MAVLLSATNAQHLEARWQADLDALRRRYTSEPSPELRTQYLAALKEFADFVLRGKRPRIY